MKPPVIAVFVFAAALCAGGELDVAREALRDGLWEVARTHASRAKEPEAREVIVESYAREGKWRELLASLEAWQYPESDAFVYYRALALVETDKAAQAGYILSDRKFSSRAFARLAARLRARIAMVEGGAAEALKVLKASGEEVGDEDSEMFAASLLAATGDRVGAAEIWREVAARGTNASERAFVESCVALGDEKLLLAAFERASAAETKRRAGFALARARLATRETLDEGAKLLRALVHDTPDADGARDALVALAEAYYAAGRYAEAAATYREIFETWPSEAKSSALQAALGWALEKLGRYDEAFEAFARAEETATTDLARATAIVKQGDARAAAGKREAAVRRYRDALERYPATEPANSIREFVKLRDLEDRGRDLCRECRFAEAQEVFREVAEKDPSRKPRMEYLEIMCLYGQGLDDEAAEHARRLSSDSPDADVRAAATLWLAKHAYNRGSWAEARKLFAVYAEMSPADSEAPEALVWSARAAFAENDFAAAIQIASKLAERYAEAPARVRGFLVQGESLIELARFDEAVLVLERVARAEEAEAHERLRARILGADALFAMGADNPLRYQEALEAYRAVRMGEELSPSQRLVVSFKIARTLEKLKRIDEAVDRYYTDVVLAYREGRVQGQRFDDEARASFSRAALRLADEFESRGRDAQAVHILELLVASDVPAAAEATRRIQRIQRKGKLL